MPSNNEAKEAIKTNLAHFQNGSLAENAINLLDALGYRSDRRERIEPNDAEGFLRSFGLTDFKHRAKAHIGEWQTIDLLFQLTDEEISFTSQTPLFFDSSRQLDDQRIESYLFFAVRLKRDFYSRSVLAEITREINRLFLMPAMIIFQHGASLTLSVINRRLHKRDPNADVLEKVTLIKDIRHSSPLRAHLDILHGLSLEALYDEFHFHNFVGLHRAWERQLDNSELNRKFYQEIANWFFWASNGGNIIFPRDVKNRADESIFLIRLLTRLIFCWFLQEKGLIPPDVFRERHAREMLADFSPKAGTYYRAFLQNLFFATLNQEQDKRGFRRKSSNGRDGNRGVGNLYRYADLLRLPDKFAETLRAIPFVNGGLFDCLDTVLDKGQKNTRLDDFSEEKANDLLLPNELFFSDERAVDLSDSYGGDAKKKREKVRGLIDILSRYKFTVEENTPLEEEIALDPELLGRVFENLLASYNPDTQTTARKATGSFYTPREIVGYMVDEALIAYFSQTLETAAKAKNQDLLPNVELRLRGLFSTDAVVYENVFDADETRLLVTAIDRVKILDPACGSGAFLMGALHRLVDLLKKLDSSNEHWETLQRVRVHIETEKTFQSGDKDERKERLDDINEVFERNTDNDYGRKLYLIENCIYGVDIQPIACQIAKLRFFISLIVDQTANANEPNAAVRPLPNLEAKIVAADALMRLDDQHALLPEAVRTLRQKLEAERNKYFFARSPETKRRCKERDENLRFEIADILRQSGWDTMTADKMAGWNPYDQNAHAEFFDSEWMFGLPIGKVRASENPAATLLGSFAFVNELPGQMKLLDHAPTEIESGFDVVIGNPPYVRQEQIKHLKPALQQQYDCYTGMSDLYVYFYERSVKLLKAGGVLSFVTSNKWLRSGYGEKLRDWLAKNSRVLQLIDFGDAPVFTAIAYPCIVIARKNQNAAENSKNTVRVFTHNPDKPVEQFAEHFRADGFELPQAELKKDGWRLESGATLRLLEKLRAMGTPLGKYVDDKFYRGILTGLNDAFVVKPDDDDYDFLKNDESSVELLKQFLLGRNVKRWQVNYAGEYLIKIESSANKKHAWTGKSPEEAEKIFAETYPAVYERFKKYRPQLLKREDKGVYFWELRSCTYWNEFQQPKIIYPNICSKNEFAWDENLFITNQKAYIISHASKFLLGYLNSNVVMWLFDRLLAKLMNGYYEPNANLMKDFPIPHATPEQHAAITNLVEYILTAKSFATDMAGNSLLVGYFEQIINALVYELFFADELHAAGLQPFKLIAEANLPTLNESAENNFALISETFERLYDQQHPLRGALFDLGSLEIVSIIEGRE